MPREDLTGRQFDDWKVISYAEDNKWLCECQCELHTRREVLASSLKRRSSTCCGDRKMHPVTKNFCGTYIGEIYVDSYVGDSTYRCKCLCGKELCLTSRQIKRQSVTDCGHVRKDIIINKTKEVKPKYKPAGDWTVLYPTKEGYYMCRCICGYTKEMSNSSIYNARKNNYQCKHAIPVNTVINNLKILGRDNNQPAGKQYKCQCLLCNKIVYYGSYSLLNNKVNSCGCSKAPTYTKEQVIALIENYRQSHNGSKPQPLELKDLLGLGETATYEYIQRYGLQEYVERHQSLGERQVCNIFESSGLRVIKRDRKILNGKELDIYIPEKKLALEFNGSYWHSSERKDRNYHQEKTIQCAKQGIRLIHIFDYEWNNDIKRKKITDMLQDFIQEPKMLYARNLIAKDITNNEAQEFQNKYHLQNGINSNVNIGLFDNDELVSTMSFSTPRFNSEFQYEITRYCTKSGVGIVGGAEKLFKYFVTKYNPYSILTYVDISKFTGNVYPKLGFKTTKDCFTLPNYVWVDAHLNTLTRYQTQKHKLLEQGFGSSEQTENEIMQNRGFFKIYDCGNLKLEWHKEI